MNKDVYNQTREWLEEYAYSFPGDGASRDFLIKLKYEHSVRVGDDSLDIASGLGWREDDIYLGGIVGLLHDVGRFSQLSEYGTFHDPDSVNHGERGFEVANEIGLPVDFDDDEIQIILDGIRYHNRRMIPGSVADSSLPYLHLVRDADKVDIMHIVDTAIENKDHERYPEIMLNIDLHGPPNPALLAELRETGTASYKNVNSMADMNLIRMSWVYNINYKPALQLISDRGLLFSMIDKLPEQEDVQEVTDKAIEFMENQLG